jgi:hypothetical protein
MVARDHQPLLIESGREIGSNLLENAITTAPTVDVMQNHVFTLRYAAIHILAMTAYNDERLGGADPNEVLKEIASDLRQEYEFAKGCEAEGQLNLFAPDNPSGAVH